MTYGVPTPQNGKYWKIDTFVLSIPLNKIAMASIDSSTLREELSSEPPNTEYLKKILQVFVDALCQFVPSKPDIHAFIRSDLPLDTLTVDTMPHIVDRLTHWVEQFQAPVHDTMTTQWRNDFKTCTNATDFIVQFVDDFKGHTEVVYREVWEARRRMALGQSPVKPTATGVNGIPDDMKSGR